MCGDLEFSALEEEKFTIFSLSEDRQKYLKVQFPIFIFVLSLSAIPVLIYVADFIKSEGKCSSLNFFFSLSVNMIICFLVIFVLWICFLCGFPKIPMRKKYQINLICVIIQGLLSSIQLIFIAYGMGLLFLTKGTYCSNLVLDWITLVYWILAFAVYAMGARHYFSLD